MPAPYLTMTDIAKVYAVHLRTARRWAAADEWRRTTGKPALYSLADAQQSYERRHTRPGRVTRHLTRRYGTDASGACGA